MTRDERLMLAEHGAADPELMGAGMTAPKSAAEVMREMAVQECRIVMRDAANVISRDGVGEVAVISGVVASGLMGVIGKLPLPADPRDAEIAALRAAATKAADLFQWYADEHIAAGKTEKAARNQGAADDLRAALAQSGNVG